MSTGRARKKFTTHQIETAILVAQESKAVRNWVTSEAKFIGIDLNSGQGREFYSIHSRLAARRLLGLD